MLIKIVFFLFTSFFKPLFWIIPGEYAYWLIWQFSKTLGFLIAHSPLKKTIKNNLALIYGQDLLNLDKLTTEYIYKMARYIYEITYLGSLSLRSANKMTNFTGLEKLDEALKQNRGVLILGMHAGNWELMGCTLAQKNYPLNAVVKTPKGSIWLELIDRNRVHNKAKLINVLTENMYRSTLNALKKNEIVIIMADTGATDSDKNLPIEFLGKTLPAASGWTTIAMRTGALVLPVLCSSDNKLTEDFIFPEIIDPKNHQSEAELLSTALKHFSGFIAAHPTEWFIGLSESEVKKTFGK